MTPEALRDAVAVLYAEVCCPRITGTAARSPAWPLATDRAVGGHGHVAVGEMRLPTGSTWHCVYICDDPHGTVVHGHEGEVKVAPRAALGLTLGTRVSKA